MAHFGPFCSIWALWMAPFELVCAVCLQARQCVWLAGCEREIIIKASPSSTVMRGPVVVVVVVVAQSGASSLLVHSRPADSVRDALETMWSLFSLASGPLSSGTRTRPARSFTLHTGGQAARKPSERPKTTTSSPADRAPNCLLDLGRLSTRPHRRASGLSSRPLSVGPSAGSGPQLEQLNMQPASVSTCAGPSSPPEPFYAAPAICLPRSGPKTEVTVGRTLIG